MMHMFKTSTIFSATRSSLLRLLLLALSLKLSGCATIHFDNGKVLEDPEPYWFEFWADDKKLTKADGLRYHRWYHHSLYSIAELSNPVQLDEVCQGLDWNRVTTYTTPLDLILGTLDNALFIPASSAGIDLWSLWSVEYSCRQ